MRLTALTLFATLLLAAGCAENPLRVGDTPPAVTACPKGVPQGTRCLGGQDVSGAFYLIAIPAKWNRVLVLHAHGGPAQGAPTAKRVAEDLERWDVTLRAGYAWAGSSFRQGGVAVRVAAEDTERLRRIFNQHIGRPERTLLHGQSWGASVAAKGAEMYATAEGGRSPYDGVLLTSGVLAGGTRSYDFRLDLRVVYQYLCGNHLRADETAYPLWVGLPPDSRLTRPELAARVNECLGINLPAARRSSQQQERLQTIVNVIRIPESSIIPHLNWATWHFQDIAMHRTGGRPAFGNDGVQYRGSADDAALNAGVLRYKADPRAVARFGRDTDPSGRIPVPVLTVHGKDDATAFVELESAFKATMTAAGAGDRLVQTYVDSREHSYLSDPVYVTSFEALLRWVERSEKPTPQSIASSCTVHAGQHPGACRFLPDYQPAPLESRVAPR